MDCLVTDGGVAGVQPGWTSSSPLEQRSPVQQLPVIVCDRAGGRASRADGPAAGSTARHGAAPGATCRRACSIERRLLPAPPTAAHAGGGAPRRRGRARADRHRWPASKVLIVDDDMRNIFALATVLDEQGMEIVSADNGRDAIRLVQEDPTSTSC